MSRPYLNENQLLLNDFSIEKLKEEKAKLKLVSDFTKLKKKVLKVFVARIQTINSCNGTPFGRIF